MAVIEADGEQETNARLLEEECVDVKLAHSLKVKVIAEATVIRIGRNY